MSYKSRAADYLFDRRRGGGGSYNSRARVCQVFRRAGKTLFQAQYWNLSSSVGGSTVSVNRLSHRQFLLHVTCSNLFDRLAGGGSLIHAPCLVRRQGNISYTPLLVSVFGLVGSFSYAPRDAICLVFQRLGNFSNTDWSFVGLGVSFTRPVLKSIFVRLKSVCSFVG